MVTISANIEMAERKDTPTNSRLTVGITYISLVLGIERTLYGLINRNWCIFSGVLLLFIVAVDGKWRLSR